MVHERPPRAVEDPSSPKAVDTGGRYVFQLRNDSDWADQQFLSLEIEAPEDMPQGLEVQASICQAAPAKASQSVAGR
ncbi:alginate biosynthesis protein AlgX [Pseudomonas aeruginosa]